jgi:hypothetical protein
LTWSKWHKFLKRQLKHTLDSHDVFESGRDWDSFRNWMKALHSATQPSVAAAVESFAATGRWPPMMPMERYFLRQRILFALRLIDTIRTKCLPTSGRKKQVINEPSPRLSDAEIIGWLLADIWLPHGFVDWSLSLDWEYRHLIQMEIEPRAKDPTAFPS